MNNTSCTIVNEIKNNRIPLTAFIMLTSRCNFYCKHCFLSPEKNAGNDISKEKWYEIFEILKKQGTIFLIFSGGEPLCREDFSEIYETAFDMGFKIVLFTNASLINEQQIALFKSKPPYKIEISLYGMRSYTYECFCGIKINHNDILRTIRNLVELGIKVKIKVVANKYNIDDLCDMRDFCKSLNLTLHIYRMILCDIYENSDNTYVQLSDDEIIKTYLINDDFCRLFVGFRKSAQDWDNGYLNCGAGISSCHIDNLGNLYLCNKCYFPKFSFFDGFKKSWDNIYYERKKKIEVTNSCSICERKYYCGKCTPILNTIQDKKYCIDIFDIANKLGIPKEKCIQYHPNKDFHTRKMGKFYLLYSSLEEKSYLLNKTSWFIYNMLVKGYTLFETAIYLEQESNMIDSRNNILADVVESAKKLETIGAIKRVILD